MGRFDELVSKNAGNVDEMEEWMFKERSKMFKIERVKAEEGFELGTAYFENETVLQV